MNQRGLKEKRDRTIVQSPWGITPLICACILILSLTATLQGRAAASQQQKTFSSPEDAVHAVTDALRNDDRSTLVAILGKDADAVLSSGDPVADKNSAQHFLKDYDQMHRFSHGPDGKLFLVVGAENWPVPIPLDKNSAGWYFDTPYGKREVLFRRVGRNERSTIATLNAIVAGQHEYFDQSHDNGATNEYARKILSGEGTHDGLYWKTAAGEPESPIGPLVAQASQEGYRTNPQGKPIPVHGYYFKMLTKQGENAPGGAKDYVIDGKMSSGFAVLAYPAIYRSSGVMTFLVDANGMILQKDLGPKTDQRAKAIDSYDPDRSWQPAE